MSAFDHVPPFAALLFLLTLASPVDADLGEAESYKGRQVASLEIRGLDGPLSSQLRQGLALAQRRGVFRRKADFYPRVLDDDVARVRLWLARQGFPHAAVSESVQPRGRDEVDVVLQIDPGPPVLLETLEVLGWPEPLPMPHPPKTLRAGRRFIDVEAQSWAVRLQSQLHHDGYALARVVPAVDPVPENRVRLRLEAQPGQRFEVGQLEVRGCSEDLTPLVRKTMGIQAGDRFSPEALEQADQRLRRLELFRQIKIAIEPAESGQLLVATDLTQRSPRTIEAGIGYYTEELIRVRAQWRHLNLLRRGRGVQLGASWSIHLRELNAATWWPALWGGRTRLVLSGSFENEIEDSYELTAYKTALGLQYQKSLTTTWSAGLQYERVDVDEKTEAEDAFDATRGTLLSTSVSWLRDTSDDRLDPTAGTVLLLRAEGTLPGRPSDVHFAALEGSGTIYRSIAPEWVWAANVQTGWAWPLEDSTDLLPNKRFYAGGSTSMRGFGRRRLGPVDSEGSPLGGEVKFVASSELRFPLWGNLRGALFADAGQVWSRRQEIELSELELAVGPALMFRTPLGPIRADLGLRLTDVDPDAPNIAFHLSIGHPY